MEKKEIFEKTPYLGYYSQNFTKFIDEELFDLIHRNFIKLKKVKLWYGTSEESMEKKLGKITGENILGIQCEYLNSITGEIKSTNMNCGKITGDNIITKVLDLSNNDYITKFIICYNNIISYIKFETKFKQNFEVGAYNKDLSKTLKINSSNERYMLVSFYGYYNELGLRAIGCNYISKEKYIFLYFIDFFRYRHYLKKNYEEKEKWTDVKINALTYFEKLFINVCLLPTALFFNIIKYF